jgi:hypothetical protein
MLMDSPREVRCTDTNAILTSPRDEHVSADARRIYASQASNNLRDVLLANGGRWIRAKLMNYDVIIITEADFSDDPAFIYPFKANRIEDFEVGVREAIAEWRRCNHNQISWRPAARCWLKAIFSCSAQAVADAVS